ncbi:DUF3179 domain-containing protein [Spongiimicrobium sp. 2-473A-2-J]|uniref:DUF3179 domain-containing protein n=1 Tax=Eudoraea algarum TaxID=3417568 RepID=UPI003D36D25B
MVSYIKLGSLLCFLLSGFFLLSYFNVHEGARKSAISPAVTTEDQPATHFINLVSTEDEGSLNSSFSYIDRNWEASYEPMLLETFYFSQNRKISNRLRHLLERKTQQDFGYDFDAWFHWLWNKEPQYMDTYYTFKANLHQLLDPKFRKYFLDRAHQSTIRLDEVRWGGVPQDGIPPLRSPEMITVDEASYLRDSNIVFGISVNGDARAYPKRILAWHEMFVDTVGDVPVAGVYCTLCGTVILYKTEHNGINHQLGTSGFLYRSNKLMYDKATQSLWSTLEGEPAIGPLVGKGIKLDYLSVVTTTWGEWKKRHPQTTVLSLNTGHRRDYGEGVAYQEYFATDELMFTVPTVDRRLKNKDEILSVRMPGTTDENLAISHKFLKRNPVYHSKIGSLNFVVFTDRTGAHRVYHAKEKTFNRYDGTSTVTDSSGISWTLSEEKMVGETGEELQRIPTHNAFWFGYHAAFPDAKLIR